MSDQPSIVPTITDAASSRRRFSAHVAGTLLARLLAVAGGVGASIIVARLLGAEGLGALAVINTSVALAVQVGNAGLPSTNTYFVARDGRNLAAAFANSLVFALTVGSLLALGMIALGAWRAGVFGDVPLMTIAVAAASIPFQLITLLSANIFLGAGSLRRFNLLETLRQSFVLVNVILALVVAGAGLFTLVSLNTAASILVSLLVVKMMRPALAASEGARARPDAELFRRMAGYGLRVYVATLVPMMIIRADLLIVQYFRGAAEAGVYDVASQVAAAMMLLPGVIGTILFPRVAAARDARGEMTSVVTRHTAFVMLPLCLAAVPVAFLLPIFYGAEFADAGVQLLILLPGVYFISVEAVMVQHFSGTGLPATIPLFWVATLVVNLALNLALVPRFGGRGAALASSVCYILIFALVAFYFRRRTGNTLSSALLLRASELRALPSIIRRERLAEERN